MNIHNHDSNQNNYRHISIYLKYNSSYMEFIRFPSTWLSHSSCLFIVSSPLDQNKKLSQIFIKSIFFPNHLLISVSTLTDLSQVFFVLWQEEEDKVPFFFNLPLYTPSHVALSEWQIYMDPIYHLLKDAQWLANSPLHPVGTLRPDFPGPSHHSCHLLMDMGKKWHVDFIFVLTASGSLSFPLAILISQRWHAPVHDIFTEYWI